MAISSLLEAIKAQIEINRYLALNEIRDLVGDYGEMLVHKALGGERQNAVNRGFDIRHNNYKRIEVKTRKYELKRDGSIKKENRAEGFEGKENNFEWLAHVVLDIEFNVVNGCLAKYEEVWPEIKRTTKKVGYAKSSGLPSSRDITEELEKAQHELVNSI